MALEPEVEGALPEHVLALLKPDAYEHPVQNIEIVQTHISYVILAGRFAYKLKKPVNLGFLDFTTLEQRKSDCMEEVRLNSRTCSSLYYGVLTVSRDGGRYRLGGPGEVVDYAVQMRRLPPERMLSALLDRGEVTFDLIGKLASKVERFHATAEGGPRVRSIGGYETMVRNWVQNLRDVLPFVGRTVTPAQFDGLRDYAEAFVERHRGLLLSREDEGRIRDCHGDLRADAVCVEDESPSGICIFDCLEFDESLRCSDTGLDIAFLAMDFERLGHREASDLLLSLYTSAAADASLPLVSRLYRAYRATIRGKVASIRAGQKGLAAPERGAALTEARRHFELALEYAQPNHPPALIMVMGPSGSGKSVLAGALAHRIGAGLLSTDIVRKSMTGGLGRRRPVPLRSGPYTAEMNERVYSEMAIRAEKLLRDGHAVVLDGTYLGRDMRAPVIELAARAGVPLLVVECGAPDEVVRARQEGREKEPWTASDATWEVYLDQKGRFEPPAEVPEDRRLHLDTASPLSRQLAEVMSKL